MVSPAEMLQRKFDYYRKKALENGYTNEEIDSVEQRLKALYRNSRHPLYLPHQIDLIWAAHNLLNIEREMNDLIDNL